MSTQVRACGGDQKSDDCFSSGLLVEWAEVWVWSWRTQVTAGECLSGTEARVTALTPAGTQRHRFTAQHHLFRDLWFETMDVYSVSAVDLSNSEKTKIILKTWDGRVIWRVRGEVMLHNIGKAVVITLRSLWGWVCQVCLSLVSYCMKQKQYDTLQCRILSHWLLFR